jgi:predicted nucleic acid-binding protein
VSEPRRVEVILCDTTFVSLQERAHQQPETVGHWPRQTVSRLDAAILALSVISLGEIRAGRIYAGWGQRRSEQQEARPRAFLLVPLDEDILDQYALLHAWNVKGHNIEHNDLWIAASAISRGIPLVSCDKDHEAIARDHALDLIYLPPRPRE